MALEVQSGSFTDELVTELPLSSTTLSLDELLHGHQDPESGYLGSNSPLESFGIQKGTHVNEEFIFVTESERLSKIDVPVAQFLDVKRLSEKLGRVVGRMSQRTDVGAVETILNAEDVQVS
jgi:hypothetical protein